MLNIVLTRIDDRLIHGQVATAWSKVTSANRIIIVDDSVVKEPFMVKVMKFAAPSSVKVDVYSTQDAIKVLKGEKTSEKVIVLVKTPKTINQLVKGGVGIKELNVGGMGAGVGRKQLYKNISISDEERETFRELINSNVNVFIQIVPDAKAIPMEKFI